MKLVFKIINRKVPSFHKNCTLLIAGAAAEKNIGGLKAVQAFGIKIIVYAENI